MAATSSATVSTSNYNPERCASAATYCEPLLEGVGGTFQALDAMARAVRGEISPDFSGYRDAHNAAAALGIGRESINPAVALFRYVRDQIAYVDHPMSVQVVKDCQRTLESGEGDCVSKSVCLATLLASLGIEPRFVAQARDGANYDHVYVEAYLSGQWVALDPTADGKDGRPLGDVGWSQQLPSGGIETSYPIFFSAWGESCQ